MASSNDVEMPAAVTEIKTESGSGSGSGSGDISEQSVEAVAAKELLASRTTFTSEHFKIEINGIPKYFGAKDAKKLMNALDLKPHKVKQCGPGARYMFVNFSNEEEREKAIAVINGYKYKGNKLRALKAGPKKDPFLRTHEAMKDQIEDESVSPEELLLQTVCKYGHKSYDDQLASKMSEIEGLMSTLRKEVFKQNAFLVKRGIASEEIATIEPFVRSKVINGYRNKCEFSFGKHPKIGETTVGFRLTSYKKGSLSVVGVEHLPNVSDKMKKIAKKFENFAKETGYEPFDFVSHTGHWKQLTVRTSSTGEVLVWAILHPQDMTTDQRTELKNKMVQVFVETETDPEIKATSLHVQFHGQRLKGDPEPEIECISGTPTITETLTQDKLKFSISPPAFFQVNTEGAEKLYEIAGDIAALDKDTVLLDVCCGTGTIGICLASRCKEVVGVDFVPQAIEDARANAARNNISNATYVTGRAEHMLCNMLKQTEGEGVRQVAIVDPPRAGLHHKAINAIRSSSVQRLVYISCDAKSAMQNFINLGQLPSNLYQGDPFIPKRVIPVDLFPHTPHFELIIYFERFPLMKLASMESEKVEEQNIEEKTDC